MRSNLVAVQVEKMKRIVCLLFCFAMALTACELDKATKRQAVSYVKKTYPDCAKPLQVEHKYRQDKQVGFWEIRCEKKTYLIRCFNSGCSANCKTITWFPKEQKKKSKQHEP